MSAEVERQVTSGGEGSAVVAHTPGQAEGEQIVHETPEDFGWHHEWRRSTPVIGWIMVIAMLALNFGNQRGHVENIYLTGIALIMAAMLVRSHISKRDAWRR